MACLICVYVFVLEQLCQTEWNEYGGRCYLVVEKTVNYSSARSDCEDMGATLATIGDEEENIFVRDL